LESRPFLTKGLTGGFVVANGDLLCQYLMHRNNGTAERNRSFWNVWSTRRTLHFFCLGSLYVAPVLHVWYGTLNRMTAAHAATRSKWGLLAQRVALDQFLFAPLFTPTFLMGLWWLDGTLSWDMVQRQLPAIMPNLMCVNWMIWIPAQAINFSLVPLPYQVLFNNVVSLFWNAIVSFLEQQKEQQPEATIIAETKDEASLNVKAKG
jgi:hypothetical protein